MESAIKEAHCQNKSYSAMLTCNRGNSPSISMIFVQISAVMMLIGINLMHKIARCPFPDVDHAI
jgi:hypothetical protein